MTIHVLCIRLNDSLPLEFADDPRKMAENARQKFVDETRQARIFLEEEFVNRKVCDFCKITSTCQLYPSLKVNFSLFFCFEENNFPRDENVEIFKAKLLQNYCDVIFKFFEFNNLEFDDIQWRASKLKYLEGEFDQIMASKRLISKIYNSIFEKDSIELLNNYRSAKLLSTTERELARKNEIAKARNKEFSDELRKHEGHQFDIFCTVYCNYLLSFDGLVMCPKGFGWYWHNLTHRNLEEFQSEIIKLIKLEELFKQALPIDNVSFDLPKTKDPHSLRELGLDIRFTVTCNAKDTTLFIKNFARDIAQIFELNFGVIVFRIASFIRPVIVNDKGYNSIPRFGPRQSYTLLINNSKKIGQINN